MVSQFRQDARVGYAQAATAVVLSTEQGLALGLAKTTCFRDWALIAQEQGEKGPIEMDRGFTDCRVTGAEVFMPYLATLLAEGYSISIESMIAAMSLRRA